MSDHERNIDDDAGLGDSGDAVARPETARAKATAYQPTVVVGSGTLTVEMTATANAEVTRPKVTTMGYVVTKTFTIHESETVDGVIQYELLDDGEAVWVGTGDDRVDGLLKIIMHITGEEPEVPDN
jgi:hypothetical protein